MANFSKTGRQVLSGIKDLLGPNAIACGFETLSIGASAVHLASIPTDATGCIVQIESTTAAPLVAIRYQQFGTPTALVGTFGTNGDQIELVGNQSLQQIQFINVAGTSKVNVTYFK